MIILVKHNILNSFFLLISAGCYRGSATMTTSPDQRQENKRVAICADFCSDANFTHFGVMVNKRCGKDMRKLNETSLPEVLDLLKSSFQPECYKCTYDIIRHKFSTLERMVHWP